MLLVPLLCALAATSVVSENQCAVEKQTHNVVIQRRSPTETLGFTWNKEDFEVVSVVTFGPAHMSGLRKGDLIVGGQGEIGGGWANKLSGTTKIYLTVSREPPLEGVWVSPIGRITLLRQSNYHYMRFALNSDEFPAWTEPSTTHTIKPCSHSKINSASGKDNWCDTAGLFSMMWVGPAIFITFNVDLKGVKDGIFMHRIHPTKTATQLYTMGKDGVVALNGFTQLEYALSANSRYLLFLTAKDCVSCMVSDIMPHLAQQFPKLKMARLTVDSAIAPKVAPWGVLHVPMLLFFQWGTPVQVPLGQAAATTFITEKLTDPLCDVVTTKAKLAQMTKETRLLLFIKDRPDEYISRVAALATDMNPSLSCVSVPEDLVDEVDNGSLTSSGLVLLKNLPYYLKYVAITETENYVNVMKILCSTGLKPTVSQFVDSAASEVDVIPRVIFFKPRLRFDSNSEMTGKFLSRFVSFSEEFKKVVFLVADAVSLNKQTLHAYGYALKSSSPEIVVFSGNSIGGYRYPITVESLEQTAEEHNEEFHNFLKSIDDGKIEPMLQSEPFGQAQLHELGRIGVGSLVGSNMTGDGGLKDHTGESIVLFAPDSSKLSEYMLMLRSLSDQSSSVYFFNTAQNEGAPLPEDFLVSEVPRIYLAAKHHPELSGHYISSKWVHHKMPVWHRTNHAHIQAYLYRDSSAHWVIGSYGEIDKEAVWVTTTESGKDFPYQSSSWQFWSRGSKWRFTPHFKIIPADPYFVKYKNGSPVRFCSAPRPQRNPSIGGACSTVHLSQASIDMLVQCLFDS
eukprot:TRINITY_DN7549_c0_g1_i2.p1 TRINITY_DN7549_c0_g1~~TRINITY_DN7549_c0_g1_i2.p1  ORF type:complete len:792 (+),score=101.94 TRINITY_DN7549_c0_g1_i2:59-2434(+)